MDTTNRPLDPPQAREALTPVEAKVVATALRAEAVAKRLLTARPAEDKVPRDAEGFLDYLDGLVKQNRRLGVFLTAADKKHFHRWQVIARALLKKKDKSSGLGESN